MSGVRRFFYALGVLALLLGMTACHSRANEMPAPLTLSYRGNELTVGMRENDVLTVLGDDFTMSEAESCAAQGVDRLYTYPSVRLYVFAPAQGEAVLSGVTYTDDGVKTADGLCVGCSSADVIASRGQPDEQTDTYLIYESDGAALTFTVRDGRVTGISLTGRATIKYAR